MPWALPPRSARACRSLAVDATGESADERAAVVGRSAHIRDRGGRFAGEFCRPVERGLVEHGADQGIAGRIGPNDARSDRTECDPCRSAAAVTAQDDLCCDSDHGDVHLGARNEALIGVGSSRALRRDVEVYQEFAGSERVGAGPGGELRDR
ncbi:MAG: hypothetical protein ABGY42_07515 [bacterium]